MGKDIKKEYMSKQDHNFGSFAPKDNGPSSDVGGAKKSDAPVAQGAKGQSENATNATTDKVPQTSDVNVNTVGQKLSSSPPVQNIKRDIKADLNASVTGEDPDEMEARERAKSRNPVYSTIQNAAKKTIDEAGGGQVVNDLKQTAMKATLGRGRFSLGGAMHGLKAFGANVLGSMKGAFSVVSASVAKAGAVVGGLLHTSATVGTVVVVSTAVTAASIPVAGGVGYFVNQYTQKTDGCIPDEYEEEEETGGGAEAALEWAIKIAADDSFNYGLKNKYGGHANMTGCYFCGTNDKKVKASGGDERYYKTYCCVTFVTAAYAHGAQDPEILKECQAGHVGIQYEDPSKNFTKYHCWTKVGDCKDLTINDLEPGDVIIAGNQHVCMYAGDNNIVESHGGGWSATSINVNKNCATSRLKQYGRRGGQNIVMRYTGDGGGKKKSSNSVSADSSHDAFINRVGKAARSLWKPYHIYPSVMVAAACLESDYGNSDFARERKNYFGIGAFDSNPGNAYSYKTEKQAMEAYPKVFWSGKDSVGYRKVILSPNADRQAMAVHESAYATDPDYYTKLRDIMNAYDLEARFDKGLPSFSPDMSKYGGSVNGSSLLDDTSADYNEEVAEMTADDGCGGEMDGAKDDTYIGKGMVKLTATNGESYYVLDTDWKKIMEVGGQGKDQCFQFSIAYADLVLGGKFRCAANGDAFRSTYGDGTVYGDPGKINGNDHNVGSLDEVVKTCIDEIKQGRPVIVHVKGSSYNVTTGGHYVCVVGWIADAGSSPSWDELVCIDPAYASHSSDGLHPLKGFNEYGQNYVCTFENWTKAD